MPRFDGTGPQGQGPMTGRGLGPCGRGHGRGSGYGRRYGAGRGFYGCPMCGYGYGAGFRSSKEELAALEEDKKDLQAELQALDQDIEELKKSSAKE